jgi:prepilin-type processing-associated H-X9-DG protein
MPDRILAIASGQWDHPYWRHPGPPMTVTQVVRPAETAALSCGTTTTGGISGRALRHLGGANVRFVDGHVHWLSRAESWRRGTDGNGFYWLLYPTADH